MCDCGSRSITPQPCLPHSKVLECCIVYFASLHSSYAVSQLGAATLLAYAVIMTMKGCLSAVRFSAALLFHFVSACWTCTGSELCNTDIQLLLWVRMVLPTILISMKRRYLSDFHKKYKSGRIFSVLFCNSCMSRFIFLT